MKFSLILLLSLIFGFNLSAQFEQKYSANINSPDWIKLMYEVSVDPEKVMIAHDLYYQSHPLE